MHIWNPLDVELSHEESHVCVILNQLYCKSIFLAQQLNNHKLEFQNGYQVTKTEFEKRKQLLSQHRLGRTKQVHDIDFTYV